MSHPDDFLQAFHRRFAGATSAAFADGHTDTGQSSYDLLVQSVAIRSALFQTTVLDLGCGDGHLLEQLALAQPGATLVGIDFSASELRLAKSRDSLSKVDLVLGKAQELPFPAKSISHIVSHFAFHLMSDINKVVSEMHRVLKPGGTVSLMLGGGPKIGDAFEVFLETLLPIDSADTKKIPALSDRCTRSTEGLAELFGHRFSSPIVDDFYISLDADFETVWNRLSTVYEIFYLSPDEVESVKAEFKKKLMERGLQRIPIPCTMAVRGVQLQKRS